MAPRRRLVNPTLTSLALSAMGQTVSNSFVWARTPPPPEDEPPIDRSVVEVPIQVAAGGIVPVRATAGAAGYDLCSNVAVTLLPKAAWTKVSTGIKMAMGTPPLGSGFDVYGAIRARSGLTSKGIECFHGTIDSDYRGEILVLMRNHTDEPYEIRPGEKIAQLIFSICFLPVLITCDDFSNYDTARSEGGFGSTDTPPEATIQVLAVQKCDDEEAV